MNKENIEQIINNQKDFFKSGKTLSVDFRLQALESLKEAIKENEEAIAAALKKDLGKSAFSSYMCETGMAFDEANYMLRHVKHLSRNQTVYTPIAQWPAHSYVKKSPYGNVLIMSPWNYPFLLSMDPLIDALAAGNTAVIKPSAYAPATSEIIEKIVSTTFDPEYVAVITGGREENIALLDGDFNYIFFTGSIGVGKDVMKKASEKLIPITLELGGKSPCIVEKSSDVELAARRIVFGKFLNCGQTCVAPDYIYCQEEIKDQLISAIIYEIQRQFGVQPLEDENYGKIVNEKHFNRLLGLIDNEKIVFGGQTEPDRLRIEPTVLYPVTWEDPVMQEEIFGPILPILTFKKIEDVIETLQNKPSPLALYLFTRNKSIMKKIENRLQYGGGSINDTIIQLATTHMGFGGVGLSGMGAYHGKTGFDTFTHKKSMVRKWFIPDLPVRYQPYTPIKEVLLKLFMK